MRGGSVWGDERRERGGREEEKQVEGREEEEGWKKKEGARFSGGWGGGGRGEIRDEKACLRWRKYSRGSEAPALFLKSDGAH